MDKREWQEATGQRPRRGARPSGGPKGAGNPETAGAKSLAYLLDDLVRIPGTNITLGADALLGLVPGIGDAATTTMAGIILVDAVRAGVPLPVLARMVTNCCLDALVGQIPMVGDLADIGFRSNRMNLRLLEKAVADPERERRTSVAYVAAAVGLVVLALSVMVAGSLFALWWLGKLLGLF